MDPLAGKYTPIRRLIHKFQARRDIPFRKRFFMGYDLHGNTYWEFTPDGDMQRLRRKLEPYREQLFKADYFATVPPQWLMWLRRARPNPPTLEELINDQVRQQKMKILAQHADDKWHNEKLRLEQEQQLRLEGELNRAKREAEEYERKHQKDNVERNETDPWAAAKETPVESATLNPHGRGETQNDSNPPSDFRPDPSKADPWAEADAAKNENPIFSANIKPRK